MSILNAMEGILANGPLLAEGGPHISGGVQFQKAAIGNTGGGDTYGVRGNHKLLIYNIYDGIGNKYFLHVHMRDYAKAGTNTLGTNVVGMANWHIYDANQDASLAEDPTLNPLISADCQLRYKKYLCATWNGRVRQHIKYQGIPTNKLTKWKSGNGVSGRVLCRPRVATIDEEAPVNPYNKIRFVLRFEYTPFGIIKRTLTCLCGSGSDEKKNQIQEEKIKERNIYSATAQAMKKVLPGAHEQYNNIYYTPNYDNNDYSTENEYISSSLNFDDNISMIHYSSTLLLICLFMFMGVVIGCFIGVSTAKVFRMYKRKETINNIAVQ